MTPNPAPDREFPWWLLVVTAAGVFLFWKVVADAEYAQVLRTLAKGVAITLMVTATSREQLDALYQALTSHPMVKVVL